MHVRRVTDKDTLTATVIGETNTSQHRTNEAGLLLQVELVRSNTPNELELPIQLFRQVYISRTDEDHLAAPTIHQYAVATKTLTHVSTDARLVWNTGLLSRILYSIYYGVTATTKSAAYFLLHGNLIRFMWSYPVFQAPLIVASTALMMPYYKVSTWGIIVWIFSLLSDGFLLDV